MGGGQVAVLPRDLLEWDFIKFPVLDVQDNWAKAMVEKEKGANFCRREVMPLIVFMYAK